MTGIYIVHSPSTDLILEWVTKPFQRQVSTNNNSCNIEFHPINSSKNCSYDVYLGGSLSTKSNWRSDVAIPLLKKHGLSYYNPAIRENIEILDNMTVNRIYQNGNTIEGKLHQIYIRLRSYTSPVELSDVTCQYLFQPSLMRRSWNGSKSQMKVMWRFS